MLFNDTSHLKKNKNEYFGEKVIITDRNQLLAISPEKANIIKSLRIENQVIDFDFVDFFSWFGELNSLYFYKCLVDSATLSNVRHATVLGIVDCNLTPYDAKSVLEPIKNWNYIETLDLSHNKLGSNPEEFFELNHSMVEAITVYNFILSDNGISEKVKDRIISYFKKYDTCWKVFL